MRIEHSIQQIVENLYGTDFAADNVDLDIQELGDLNYTCGKKLRMTFVDTFQDTDVKEWKKIVLQNGATNACIRVNTATGNNDLNIEYKRTKKGINQKWILRSMSLAMAAWSWYQLHLLTPEKYPLLTGW